ncbi:MAG: hypothetical protein ISS26_02755 [Candidatus Omnitrophica bacterium]|nr:hypothetical protein [Candidatus Omnitrophota bacterium]
MDKAIKILCTLAIIFFCVQAFSDNKADVDLWGNVGFVKAPVWDQDFQRVNTFSFTEPDYPWFNHEWLGQYLLYLTYAHSGNTGLLLLKLALGLCVMYVLYIAMRGACKSGPVKFLLLLLIISTAGYGFSTRPHLFTYLFYALLLLFLRRNRTIKPGQLILFPVLGVIWVNLHGAFFAGIILLVFYLIFEALKKLYLKGKGASSGITMISIAIVLFTAATLINPYGFRLWNFIFYSAGIARPFLSEWAPFTRMAYFNEHMDFVMLCAISIIAVVFSNRPKDPAWLGILLVLFVSAIMMRRNIPLFAITAAFVIPEHLEDVAGPHLYSIGSKIPRAVPIICLSVFLIISGIYTFTFEKTDPAEIEIPQNRFPVDAVRFLKANGISGNALIFFDWAEYCIWKLYPDCRVFLDGRLCSAYSVGTVDDYFDFLYMGRDWEDALDDYPTDIVFIHRANPVYLNMLSRAGWSLAYENEISGIFLKQAKHPEFFEAVSRGAVVYPERRQYEYFP